MRKNDDTWSPVDVLIFTLASLALVGVITGSVLAGKGKRSTAYLAPLETGAYPGGVTAVVCAGVVLLGALLLQKREAIAITALISGLLFALPLNAAFTTSRRISWAAEAPSDDVYTAQSLYLIASALVFVAMVLCIVKYQVLKRRYVRASMPPRPIRTRTGSGTPRTQRTRRRGSRP